MQQAGQKKPIRHLLTEPHILFPLMTLLLLIVIWSSAFALIRARQDSDLLLARESARDMAETYHAQLLRALHEIELTLSVVAYAQEQHTPELAIRTLSDRGMLPPSILFSVSVYDDAGRFLASNTSNSSDLSAQTLAEITQHSRDDEIWISAPEFDEAEQRWHLTFARSWPAADDNGQTLVTITTDAEFFVASYEITRLGVSGLLALIHDNGRMLVRRTGDTVDIDGPLITSEVPQALRAGTGELVEFAHPFDNINRLYATQQLFGFPLTLVTGVSVSEQLADGLALSRGITTLAAFASLILALVMTLLGRYSYQLHQSRLQVLQQQIEHSRKVEHMAFHDGLTGLPNRSLFSRLVSQSILEAKRDKQQFALLFLDLDKFKLINDTLGHEAGDDLLIEVARRVRNSIRESDVVARLGGDEFIALLRNINKTDEVVEIANKVLQAVCQPYMLQSHQTVITISIGISFYPEDGLDEQTLTRNADSAMYFAKQHGRNQVQLFAQLPPEAND